MNCRLLLSLGSFDLPAPFAPAQKRVRWHTYGRISIRVPHCPTLYCTGTIVAGKWNLRGKSKFLCTTQTLKAGSHTCNQVRCAFLKRKNTLIGRNIIISLGCLKLRLVCSKKVLPPLPPGVTLSPVEILAAAPDVADARRCAECYLQNIRQPRSRRLVIFANISLACAVSLVAASLWSYGQTPNVPVGDALWAPYHGL